MVGKKTYPKSKGYILNTLYDIIELQKGLIIMSDTKHGRVHYQVSMYGYEWELLYMIEEKETGAGEVSLRIIGERKDKKKEIRRELTLLDAMLSGGTDVEFSEA